MTLSCAKQINANTYGPGIFINEATILEARDESGLMQPFIERAFDSALRLKLDIGRGFTPELLIAGDFKRDANSKEVIGWGGAFVVQDALSRLGYTGELIEGNRIPPEAIDNLIGQKFFRLSYVSGVKDGGKFRYSDWNQISTLEEGAENLITRFKRSLSKGYPRNYHPDLLDASTVKVSVSDEDPF